MVDNTANHDFLSLTIEARDKSNIVIMPTAFSVGPLRRMACGRDDGGVIYAQIDFSTDRCNGTVFDVLTPEDFYRLAHALSELLDDKPCSEFICGLESFLGLELFHDPEANQKVCRITMPSKSRSDSSGGLYHHTSEYPASLRTFVELELWLEPSMLKAMLNDTEAILQRIRELDKD